MNTKNKAGGARPNSGKKTEVLEPTGRVQVCLDSTTVRLLRVLGEDNVSRGVRTAARIAYDRFQATGLR